ncbi:hypothetical protein ACMV5I_28115 [Serratia sp. T13T92]|uniref:hypothetical protein n=1 Tax=Serratia sp. T13T92 TaxID=3397496 RepID=UPI0039DF7487
MLTQKVIREEIEELKAIMASDALVIPGFWDCAKPGVVVLLLMFISPLVAFSLNGDRIEEDLFAVGMSTFIGLMILLIVANYRGFILSLPASFRNKSKIIGVYARKVKGYAIGYAVLNLVLCLLVAFYGVKSALYSFLIIPLTVFTVFVFMADISRYKLSAFTEIVKAAKAQ